MFVISAECVTCDNFCVDNGITVSMAKIIYLKESSILC